MGILVLGGGKERVGGREKRLREGGEESEGGERMYFKV
jgi:hypothetical protein